MHEQAKQTDESLFEEVQPYMVGIFPRMTFNYSILTLSIVVLWFIGVALLRNIVPQSTATAIVFALSILLFPYIWRLLEQRNQATGLFMLYTRYSRQRRDLKAQLAKETDDETLSNTLQLLQDAAKAFIQTAEEHNVEPVREE